MIDLSNVGANFDSANNKILKLGIYLPNITENKGYKLYADIIHSQDQFDPNVKAQPVELINQQENPDLWSFTGDLTSIANQGNLGKKGKHLYRYRLVRHENVIVPAFADPFAKHSGTGTFSAFIYLESDNIKWTDGNYKVPNVNDLVIYEMMVDDFAGDFKKVTDKLTYLKWLGVNCIELMPVTNIPEPYRWGYMPMSYFAIEERYGGREELMKFINECHKNEIAVIHDAVYAHTHAEFCYRKVYWETGEDNPMIGEFAGEMFGVGTDFNKQFTFDYFIAVNKYFIEELHFDGFRYDYVPGIYDGPTGKGYAKLVYETYQMTKDISKFKDPTHNRIIQAAEYLSKPKEILEETYTTASKRWTPMLEAQDMVKHYGHISETYIREQLLIDFNDPWPDKYKNANDEFPVAPIQFIESHDKSRLMYIQGGEHSPYHGGFDLFDKDRSKWYRMQPFAISLMTCEGIPLIWQGQEFGEIYGKHDDGGSRVLAARPLHWNYFYEESGSTLVNLYRKLGKLRKDYVALRSRCSYYYHIESNLNEGIAAYLRKTSFESDTNAVLVVLNFSEGTKNISLPLHEGRWEEVLTPENQEVLNVNGEPVHIEVSSNYGKIFARKS